MARLSKKMEFVKYILFFCNIIFWLSGLTLVTLGIYIHINYGNTLDYLDTKFLRIAAYVILLGFIIGILGCIGCMGAIRKSYKMLMVFSALLFVLFVFQIVAAGLGFKYRNEVDHAVDIVTKKAIKGYDTIESDQRFIDLIQETFRCCGFAGPADFKNSTNVCKGTDSGVPTCHKGGDCSKPLYIRGCKKRMSTVVKSKMGQIGGAALIIGLVQLISIAFACQFGRSVRGYSEL